MSENSIKQEIAKKLSELEAKVQHNINLNREDVEFLCLISLLEEESASVKIN